MNTLAVLVKRNVKLFFKDAGMFFTSLVTPAILLVLYVTFLGNLYEDVFLSSIPQGMIIDEDIISGCVGGQLISSLLAVSCVTVAFCSNLLMVQDKVSGRIKDLTIAPVSSTTLSLSYYFATLISTLIICFTATGICLAYVAYVGWYMSLADVLLLFIDVFILVMFSTALSSIISFFMNSQGQISAVSTIISAGYGFICGAYMPISQFSSGLRKAVMFFPGTYGTSLVRNHAMGGVLEEMEKAGVPSEAVENMKDSVDCNIYLFDNKVNIINMYAVLVGTVILLMGIYIIINAIKNNKNNNSNENHY